MPLSPVIATADLLPHLHLLVQAASPTGHSRALDEAAATVASVLRACGLDCTTIATPGAPVVIGRFDAGVNRTLLLYSHYDVAPSGPRRPWVSDPTQLVERDGVLYGRGVLAKGELAAQAAALAALIRAGTLPFNVCMVVEGEGLIGSPNLPSVVDALPPPDLALWGGASLDARGVPVLYTGAKGLLQVQLRAGGGKLPLPAAYAASAVNPIWTLVWALGSIKSEFEEVLPEGFYDDVAAPDRAAIRALQGVDVAEAERKAAWGMERFAVNLSGPLVPRTESFSPACNISNLAVETLDLPGIPSRATATIQLHLVPDQQPDTVWQQLTEHLAQREFIGLEASRLPGGYAPVGASQDPIWGGAAAAISAVYGVEGFVVSLAPAPTPASVLAGPAPLLIAGLERPTSAPFGPNEQLPMADLERYAQLVAELIVQAATV